MDPFGLLISLVAWEGTFRVSAEGTLAKPAEVASAAADADIAAPCYRGACARTRRLTANSGRALFNARIAEPAAAATSGMAR